MRVLTQIADRYCSVGGVERLLQLAGLKLLFAEFGHGIERQAFQPLALGTDPFGPSLLGDLDVSEQTTLVEAHSPHQGLPGAVAEPRLEPRDITGNRTRLE